MKSTVWLLLAGAAFAAEPLKLPLDVGTLKTRDGKVLESAKIVGHDAVGVKVVHAGGTARVTFERLPRELANRFPRDRDAAKEQLEKEAKQESSHDKAVERAADKHPEAEAGDDEELPETNVEDVPVLKGDPEVKIASLEAYVSRLEAGIEKARSTAMDARARADKYQSTATTTVTRTNSNGTASTREVTNKSRMNRAAFQRKRAAREDEKIQQAQVLIKDAHAQIVEFKKLLKD